MDSICAQLNGLSGDFNILMGLCCMTKVMLYDKYDEKQYA